MKNYIRTSFEVFLLMAVLSGIIYGQGWKPGDPHKMHFPQLPDETGWAVNATEPVMLADDWQCSQTGWVRDFHFWGSWRNGTEGKILHFTINIYEDWPVGHPDNPNDYSMPGDILWQEEISDFGVNFIFSQVTEGWYDPEAIEIILDDHQIYYQYDIYLPENMWFHQDEGTIYWVSISAVLAEEGPLWGWKSSIEQWNDDATRQIPGQYP